MLSMLDHKMDKNEKSLMVLHRDFPNIMREILSDFAEKGYAFLSKKVLRKKIGDRAEYYRFIYHIKNAFRIEQTATSIIIYPFSSD